MPLQAYGRSQALRHLLRTEQERDPDFLCFANALTALLPARQRGVAPAGCYAACYTEIAKPNELWEDKVWADNHDILKRITARPDVFGGKPIIRDMRISVEFVLSLLSQGATQDELLDDYPFLEPDDIRACIAYAHTVISGDTLAPVSVAGQ